MLDAHGALPVQRLVKEGRMSRSACLHHLANLMRRGLVVARRVGRTHLYARTGKPGFGSQAAAMPSERAQRVLAVAAANPHARQHEIARLAGVTQSYVSRVLNAKRGRPEATSDEGAVDGQESRGESLRESPLS